VAETRTSVGERAGVGIADQHDIVEIPLYELVHQVVDLLYVVHPFLYTFPWPRAVGAKA
jgi:hypothetical protein